MDDSSRNGNNSSLPLRSCVLCCTSISPEQRTAIASIASQMGAAHKLDLTSDVTHLLVGKIDTPKYKYVARERPDVRVLHPDWIAAVRDEWLQGGDTDVLVLENKFKLPPLYGLTICMTGFDNPGERAKLIATIEENGGQYTGDLERTVVTHLMAAAPEGRKYDYATQWGLKVVSLSWFMDTLERGMVLDEALYHPCIPLQDQGKGAVNMDKMKSFTDIEPILGKRQRDETKQAEPGEIIGKRKLRRTASTRLESQNDDFWANIGSGNEDKNQDQANAALGRDAGGFEDPTRSKKHGLDGHTSQAKEQTLTTKLDLKSHSTHTADPSRLVFKRVDAKTGERMYVQGFERRKQNILQEYLSNNGADVLSREAMKSRFPDEDPDDGHADPRDRMKSSLSVTIIVPYDTTPQQLYSYQNQDFIAPTDLYVSDFWVEKCLYSKRMVPPATPLCEPFNHDFPLPSMVGLTICPTSFVGMDLLHLSKAVRLTGASYDEYLRPETSLLVVCNTDEALAGGPSFTQQQKLQYAFKHHIPIVSADWLWQSLIFGQKQVYEDYSLVKSSVSSGSLRFYHPQTNPKAKPATRLHRTDAGIGRLHNDAKARQPSSADHSVLQEIHPEMNSPPKQDTVRTGANTRQTNSTGDVSLADIPTQPISNEATNNDEKENDSFTPSQRTANLNNAIEELLAQKRSSAAAASHPLRESTINHPISGSDPATSRRHRPLGRATSNISSIEAGRRSLSRSNSLCQDAHDRLNDPEHKASMQQQEDLEAPQLDPFSPSRSLDPLDGISRSKVLQQFRPSQALTYEDPEAAAVRDKVMKRLANAGKAAATRISEANEAVETATAATATLAGVRVASIGTVKNASGIAAGSENFSFVENKRHSASISGAAAAAGRRRTAGGTNGRLL